MGRQTNDWKGELQDIINRHNDRHAVKAKGVQGRQAPSPQPASSVRNGLTASDLLETKKLVDQLGGIEQAREALATLEQLQ